MSTSCSTLACRCTTDRSRPGQRPSQVHCDSRKSPPLANIAHLVINPTFFQSVLSEVYAADKTPSGTPASSSAITSIIRRAITRRVRAPTLRHLYPPLIYPRTIHCDQFDAATQFESAARPDLAHKEREEAVLLESFLPPLLPEADIDCVLQHVLSDPALADARSKGPPQRALGLVLKAFYTQVDKSTVDPELVRQRAQALLQ